MTSSCPKAVCLIAAVLGPQASMAQEARGPYLWSGPYIGLTLGYGGAEMATSTGTGSSDGREMALYSGFSWVRGTTMFGIEADVSLNIGTDYVFGEPVPVGNVTAAVDWLGTFRGRYGVIREDTLVYGTFGLSYSDTVSNGRSYDLGYVFGGGLERQIRDRWSWRGEVLYHEFSPDGVTATRAELENAWSVRLGLTRHF